MSLRESCGVYGVHSKEGKAFLYLYWGMVAQNHRGHQSHGFTTFDSGLNVYTELGLIPVTTPEKNGFFDHLSGGVGIANVRYATSGHSDPMTLKRNAMPILKSDGKRSLAISFNGNIVNVLGLQEKMGVDPNLSDAHTLCNIIFDEYKETGSITEGAKTCMEVVDGSLSVTGVTDGGGLFAFKNPVGIKPLCYGCSSRAEAFSSESVGLDVNNIDLDHELKPGEFMTVEEGVASSERLVSCRKTAFCAFEYAYFARPDSIFNDRYVYQARCKFGGNLARRFHDVASRCDVVISLPETANDAAYGFHEESGLPWDMATRRNRYVTHRAFITGEEERDQVVLRKVNILKPRIKGRRLAVVDDSIVRGDTTRSAVARFKAAGAKEIHLFITFPCIIGPCFYGVDMATFGELIGVKKNPEEIAEELGVDSVNYQPIDDYVSATGMERDQLCLGCVTGDYPTPMANQLAKYMWERLVDGEEEKGRIYEVPKITAKS